MSLPRYPEYKVSGVAWLGEVPVHWKAKRFKHVFKERDERSEDGSEMLLSVSAYTGVSPRSEIVDDGDHLSRADSLEGYKICFPNDLVMNIMLAWNRGLAFSNYEGIVSPAYGVFRVIDGSFPKFLNYLVRTNLYTLYFKAFSSGVIDSRLRLYPDVFGSLFCVLPALEEQKVIAAFLDRETGKIDALIAEQQRLVELLAEKRQAVISHAVTRGLNPNARMKDSGIEWLGEVPEHWEVKRLKFLCDVQTGDKDTVDAIDEGEYPFFVRSQTVERINSFTFDCEAVLTAGDGAGVGKVFHYINGKFDFHQRVYMMNNFRLVTGKFFFRYLAALFYKVALDGGAKSTVDSLRMPLFMNFGFTVPPHGEQSAIVAFVDTETAKFDTLTAEANRVIALLQERRSALISAAVTGKIDVRETNAHVHI